MKSLKAAINTFYSFGFYDEVDNRYFILKAYGEKEAKEMFQSWLEFSKDIPTDRNYTCINFKRRLKVKDDAELVFLSRRFAPVLMLADSLVPYDNDKFPLMLKYVIRRQDQIRPRCLYAKTGFLDELIVDTLPDPIRTEDEMQAALVRQSEFTSDRIYTPVITEMKYRFLKSGTEHPEQFRAWHKLGSHFLYTGPTGEKLCISSCDRRMTYLKRKSDGRLKYSSCKLRPEVELIFELDKLEQANMVYELAKKKILSPKENTGAKADPNDYTYFRKFIIDSDPDVIRDKLTTANMQRLFDNALEILESKKTNGIYHCPLQYPA